MTSRIKKLETVLKVCKDSQKKFLKENGILSKKLGNPQSENDLTYINMLNAEIDLCKRHVKFLEAENIVLEQDNRKRDQLGQGHHVPKRTSKQRKRKRRTTRKRRRKRTTRKKRRKK